MRSLRSVVSLQSPFQHTTDPEMATLRIYNNFLWKVEEPSLKIKLTCIRSSDSVLLKAVKANFFPEDEFKEKSYFFSFFFFFVVQHFIF